MHHKLIRMAENLLPDKGIYIANNCYQKLKLIISFSNKRMASKVEYIKLSIK